MYIHKKVSMNIDDNDLLLKVGNPSSPEEKRAMHSLRYDVYADNGYINPNKYEDNLEKDHYDTLDSTEYYISMVNDKLVGACRTICDYPLPTRKAFDFEEPNEIKQLSKDEIFEIGRLIITPYNQKEGVHPPKGIILLFLFEAILQNELEEKMGGYAFIKSSLQKKLESRNIPFHKIEDFNLNVKEDNNLYRYFIQKKDPVIPVFFKVNEVGKYIQLFTENPLVFRQIKDKKLKLRSLSYQIMRYFYN